MDKTHEIPVKFVYVTFPDTGELWGSASINASEFNPDVHILERPPGGPKYAEGPNTYKTFWDKASKQWYTKYTEIGLEVAWGEIKSKRNQLIAETDWTQLNDVVLSPEKKAAVNSYRQELRDITKKFTNPDDVVWPTSPL